MLGTLGGIAGPADRREIVGGVKAAAPQRVEVVDRNRRALAAVGTKTLEGSEQLDHEGRGHVAPVRTALPSTATLCGHPLHLRIPGHVGALRLWSHPHSTGVPSLVALLMSLCLLGVGLPPSPVGLTLR